MRRLSAVVLVILCLAVVPSLAAEEAPRRDVANVIKNAVAEVTFVTLEQSSGQFNKVDWQVKMEQAQGRRSRGVRYVFVGIGTSVVGSVVAASSGTNYSVSSSGVKVGGGAGRTIGLLTTLAGGGVFWFGVYNWIGGANDVDVLDREGRAKGFLSLAPTDGGAQMAWNVSF